LLCGELLQQQVVTKASCYVASCYVASCDVGSCYVVSCYVASCVVASCDVASCYVANCKDTLCCSEYSVYIILHIQYKTGNNYSFTCNLCNVADEIHSVQSSEFHSSSRVWPGS
jgi:hypothetical protein